MESDKVRVTNILFICASCGREVYSPKRGCEYCGSKKHIPKLERDWEEEKEINEILERAKKDLDIYNYIDMRLMGDLRRNNPLINF